MKKLFALSVLFLALCFSTPAIAGDSAQTGGKQTASAVVYSGPCVLTFVKLVEAGADSTLTLYDSATATTSGKTIMDYLEVMAGDGQVGGPMTVPLTFSQGVYAVVTGTSAYYFVHTKPN